MKSHDYTSLSLAMNALDKEGFIEQFSATSDGIKATNSDKDYSPTDLKVVRRYRFEGMTNPEDQTELFGLEASDGTKGTLVMSYSVKENQNRELIKKIPLADDLK